MASSQNTRLTVIGTFCVATGFVGLSTVNRAPLGGAKLLSQRLKFVKAVSTNPFGIALSSTAPSVPSTVIAVTRIRSSFAR